MIQSHPAIDALEARIASNIEHVIVFGRNGRRFHKVTSKSFSLSGSGVSPAIACDDFLRRNGLEG